MNRQSPPLPPTAQAARAAPTRHPRRLRLSRRAIALGSAAGLLAPLVAACGGADAGATPPGRPGAESGRVVHWTIPNFPFAEDIGATFAGEFRARYPSVEYVSEVVAGDRFEQLKVAAAAGSAPDIGMAGSWQMQDLGAAGIIRAHDDYLKASRVVKQADLWPTHLRDLTYKGKQYGMPFGPDVRVAYVHTDTLAAAGLNSAQPARTWDELEEHIRRLYRADAGKPTQVGFPPFWGTGRNNLWLVPFWQLGGETLSADGEKITINNDKGIAALEWLKRIHEMQGGWDALEAVRPQLAPNRHFINGALGYYFAAFSERKSPDFTSASGLRFGFTPWPVPKGGRRANYGGCHSYGVTTQSRAPDAAWRFLELLADEPNNLRFAQRYDRIPIRVRTAESPAFHQNDPFSKLAVEEMRERRILISAPGGNELLALTERVATDAMSGAQSVRAVLSDVQTQMQQVLDKYKR